MEELPPQITALMKLKELRIDFQGNSSIKRAPRGIKNLPCWKLKGLHALQLYETVSNTYSFKIICGPVLPNVLLDRFYCAAKMDPNGEAKQVPVIKFVRDESDQSARQHIALAKPEFFVPRK